jgi:hypothetical protein
MTCLALRLPLPEEEEEGEEEEEEEGPLLTPARTRAHQSKWELKLSDSVRVCAGLGGSCVGQEGGTAGADGGGGGSVAGERLGGEGGGGGKGLERALMDAKRLLLQVCVCVCV